MIVGSPAGAVESPPPAEVKSIPLLNWETNIGVNLDPMNTVYFFKGNPQDAAIHIRRRFKAVAEANPWLLGRIERNKKHRNLQLVYPAGPISETMIDQAVRIDPPGLKIHLEMPYNEIIAVAEKSKCVLPNGANVVNKADLVTRISISGDANEDQTFVIIFSMSHTVADGYTYYAIQHMLSGTGVVSTLTPTRELEVEAKMRSHVTSLDDWRMSAGFRLKVMCSNIRSSILGTRSHKFVLRRLDDRKIEDARKHATEYVSTNDIITCSCLKVANTRVAAMAMNHRGRFEGVTHAHAGNHISLVLVDKEHCATPEGVRRITKNGFLSSCRMPNFLETLRNTPTIITNVSHLPCLSLPGCEHVIQFPLTRCQVDDLFVICKCDSKETCLFVISAHNETFLSDNLPVGEEVAPRIFRDVQGNPGHGVIKCEIIALTLSILFMLVAYSVNGGMTGNPT